MSLLATLAAAAALAAGPVADSWSGLYRTRDGAIVGVGELHEFGGGEILVDYRSGEVGALFALTDGRTGVSAAIGRREPPAQRMLEHKAGRPSLDGRPLTPIPTRRRTFEATGDGVRLAGDMLLPEGRPRGAVVLVHGSGDGPRRAYDLWSNLFLSRGLAVVVYDKRGSGQSTGDWHDASLQALAGDTRAVLAWARSQPELKGRPIGLWGASQAGWIIPQVLADTAVDFAIVQGGPSTPVDDFIGATVRAELEAYGFREDEIGRALAYYDLDYAAARGLRPVAEVEAAFKTASAAGAGWLLGPPEPEGSPGRRALKALSGFDPAPYWPRVRAPTLVIFGGKDLTTPAGINRARLQTLLAAGHRVEIVVLPESNHLALLAKTGVRAEYAGLNRLDPAYLAAIYGFLDHALGPR